jgi:putative transposase
LNPKRKLYYKNELRKIDEQIKLERGKLSMLRQIKNTGINEWELQTPKEIRAGAVDDVCKAMKTGFSNLKSGIIKYFKLHFRKRTEPNKCILLAKNLIKNVSGNIQLAPQFLKENSIFKIGTRTKKKHKNIEINHDSRIVCQKNVYWMLIPLKINIQPKRKPMNYCGIDPGVRTFMTAFGNTGLTEYNYREKTLKQLDLQIKHLKSNRNKKHRVRKTIINKLETRKSNLIDELHWKTINHIIKNNDFIFYGNIKSHNIVKKGKNCTLNRDINNLKFYKFKERLLFKALERGCKVHLVNEANTTKTCSFCGCVNDVGASKIFKCKQCNHVFGRDVNAGKNILMKGIIINS